MSGADPNDFLAAGGRVYSKEGQECAVQVIIHPYPMSWKGNASWVYNLPISI